MTSGMPAQEGRGRVYGIDAWRGVVLAVLGIVYHGVGALQSDIWRDGIQEALHTFRMETFFAIAGFLAFRTRKRAAWVVRRAIVLMVPFVFVGGSILLVRNVFTHPVHWSAETSYLWFLPVLMLCSLLPRKAPRLWQVIPPALILSLIFVARGDEVFTTPGREALHFWTTALAAAPYYAVFYLAGQGIAAGTIRPRRINMWLGIAAFSLWVGWVVLSSSWNNLLPAGSASIPGVVRQLARCTVALCVMLGIFCHAMRIGEISWPMPQLSRAAYTIYLVHVPVLTIFRLVAQSLVPDYQGAPAYVLFCIGTLAICLGVHFGVVERSKMAAFLLNGRLRTGEPLISFGSRRAGTRHSPASDKGRAAARTSVVPDGPSHRESPVRD